MKLDQIKGFNYLTMYQDNTTNKCWTDLGATEGILNRDMSGPHEQRPWAMGPQGMKALREPMLSPLPLTPAQVKTMAHTMKTDLLLPARLPPSSCPSSSNYFYIAYLVLLLWVTYQTSQIVGCLSSCHRMSYMGLVVREIFNSKKGAKEAQQPAQPRVNLGDTSVSPL